MSGFNEETWKRYSLMMQKRVEDLNRLNQNEHLKKRLDNKKLKH